MVKRHGEKTSHVIYSTQLKREVKDSKRISESIQFFSFFKRFLLGSCECLPWLQHLARSPIRTARAVTNSAHGKVVGHVEVAALCTLEQMQSITCACEAFHLTKAELARQINQ